MGKIRTLIILYEYLLHYAINKIVIYCKMKLSQAEKEIVQKAKKIMHENNFNYFYTHHLLPENACSPKDYETILQLIQKGIFHPIDDSSN